MEQLLNAKKIDVVAIMREVLSPRDKIFEREGNEWLCFEAEMKVQLWLSQINTFEHLINNKK
jgi:hypothetical protein